MLIGKFDGISRSVFTIGLTYDELTELMRDRPAITALEGDVSVLLVGGRTESELADVLKCAAEKMALEDGFVDITQAVEQAKACKGGAE